MVLTHYCFSMEMEYFVNETTWIERLRFYCIKNHRTSTWWHTAICHLVHSWYYLFTGFRFRLLNFLIKIASVLLYIIRASLDDPMTTDWCVLCTITWLLFNLYILFSCGLCSVNWTDPSSNPTWHNQYKFSWQPLLFVSRGFPIWGIQVSVYL